MLKKIVLLFLFIVLMSVFVQKFGYIKFVDVFIVMLEFIKVQIDI